MIVNCSCSEAFKSMSLWRSHYDKLRPGDARGRREFAGTHVPTLAPEGATRGGKVSEKDLDPQAGLKAAIAEVENEMTRLRASLGLAIEKHHALCTELEPAPPVELIYHYYKGPVKLACFKCERPTLWRLRGLARCKNDIHRERIGTPRAYRDTKGISDKVWAIVLDEEVE